MDSRTVRTAGSQGGQIFPLALPLLVLLGACLWWVLDAAAAVSEKRRLTQAADMAALSGAVWQARTLNFDAYMNRAIIANEAVIAQSVSLRSFVDYTGQLRQNSSVVITWVPFIGQALRVLERAWSGLERGLTSGLVVLEASTSLVDHSLAAAQRSMHGGAFLAVPAIVKERVAAIDPRYEITDGGENALRLWQAAWPRFASMYGGAFRWRQQDVLYRSLDGFTAERQFRWPGSNAWGFRIERRGGTQLVNFETWRGVDTLSLHLRRYVFFGSMRERVPLGWGSAAINQIGTWPPRTSGFGDAYRVNPRAARLADASYRPQRGYLGLPSLFDLSVAQRQEFDPHPVTVRLRLPREKRRGAFGVMPIRLAHANVEHSLVFSDNDFFADASASVWFARAEERADRKIEKPNLFSPHWQARMRTVHPAERIAMAIADSTPLGFAGAAP